MTSNQLDFTVSDLIMGYVEENDGTGDTVAVRTTDGRAFEVTLGPLSAAEVLRNLGEDYHDATGSMRAMLTPGRLVFVYGVFCPQASGPPRFDAKHVVFLGEHPEEYRFEERTWWVDQIRQLADYYLRAEFGTGAPLWERYRTTVNADGELLAEDTHRQEADTISRLVYGFASAFLLTGDERYLVAAENGTEYLRDHFRDIDPETGATSWYHGIDLVPTASGAERERKIFASEFGDDYDAIPLYEQIYAMAGPVQTYRATGDRRVMDDVESTVQFFDRYFLDTERGGYFSHVEPVSLDPRAPQLGQDRARKNWNSVGDHAPAYLINIVAASGGDKRWSDMLTTTADTIVEHFGDYANSPFVNERFFEDWTHDQSWGWQQNRAVVGHNLKIAWNLMRVQALSPRPEYVEFAHRIAEVMPEAGSDLQRGGWYDVVERTKRPGDRFFPFAWHDRKAWWQQEQAILAYLILAGSPGEDPGVDRGVKQHRARARESAAFYNAWFLDHDSGGVYFNVLADGIPYLLGTERLKGSHSMAGYHSFELCYLAATYTNLLVTKQPLDLYFKPIAADLPDRVLRVAPDLLPAGAVRIARAWIDGVPTDDVDAAALAIRIPDGLERPLVRVELVPSTGGTNFDVTLAGQGAVATVLISGSLDNRALPTLHDVLARMVAARPDQVIIDLAELDSIGTAPVRAITFACQKLGLDCEVNVRGAGEAVRAQLDEAGFRPSAQAR